MSAPPERRPLKGLKVLELARILRAPEAQGGAIPGVASPIVLDGERMTARRPSPRLGAHTGEALSDPAWGGAPS